MRKEGNMWAKLLETAVRWLMDPYDKRENPTCKEGEFLEE